MDPKYTIDMFTAWSGTVDAFAGYDNLLFFTLGNEVVNEEGKCHATEHERH